MLLKISHNSYENTWPRVSFFTKVTLLATLATLLKKRLWHSWFPVNFEKFLRTFFLQNTYGGCFWKYLNEILTSQTLFSYGFYGTKLYTFVIYFMTSGFLFIDQ